MECQYCKKILQTKSSLNSHQTKTKYCLKLQGKETKGLFVCQGCDKDFNQKIHLSNHEKICEYCIPKVKELLKKIEILENEKNIWLEEKKEFLKEKKELIEIIAKNPRKTTTNIHNTLNLSIFNKSDEDIKQLVEDNYNKDYLIEGQKGVARFTHSHVLKTEPNQMPMYTITVIKQEVMENIRLLITKLS